MTLISWVIIITKIYSNLPGPLKMPISSFPMKSPQITKITTVWSTSPKTSTYSTNQIIIIKITITFSIITRKIIATTIIYFRIKIITIIIIIKTIIFLQTIIIIGAKFWTKTGASTTIIIIVWIYSITITRK